MRVVIAANGLTGGGAESIAGWLADSLTVSGSEVALWTGGGSTTPGGPVLPRATLNWLRCADVVHTHTRRHELIARSIVPEKARRFTLHHTPTRFRSQAPRSATSCPSRALIDHLHWPRMVWIPSPLLHFWQLADQEAAVLYVGRIAPDKGWRAWLEVLARVPANGSAPVRGRVYGTGPDAQLMQQRAADLGLLVEFCGWVTPSAIRCSSSDVLLLTSPAEADPLAPLEARAAGLPVVSFPVGDLVREPDAWLLGRSVDELAALVAAHLGQKHRTAVDPSGEDLLRLHNARDVMTRYLEWYAQP